MIFTVPKVYWRQRTVYEKSMGVRRRQKVRRFPAVPVRNSHVENLISVENAFAWFSNSGQTFDRQRQDETKLAALRSE
jgi:hypothetical protein